MTQHNWAFVSENTYLETKRTLQGLQAEIVTLRADNTALRHELRVAWLTAVGVALLGSGAVAIVMWRGGC